MDRTMTVLSPQMRPLYFTGGYYLIRINVGKVRGLLYKIYSNVPFTTTSPCSIMIFPLQMTVLIERSSLIITRSES